MPIDTMLDEFGRSRRATFIHEMPGEYQDALAAFYAAHSRVYEQAGNVKTGVAHFANMAGIQAALEYYGVPGGSLPAVPLPLSTVHERARWAYIHCIKATVTVQEGKLFTHTGEVRSYRANMADGVLSGLWFTIVTDAGAVEINGSKLISFDVPDAT